MLSTIYACSWISLALSTVLWFFFKRVLPVMKVPRLLFLVSLVVYWLSVLGIQTTDGSVNTLGLLLRDMGGIVAIALLAKFVLKEKYGLLLLLLGIGAGSYFQYFHYLRSSAGYIAPSAAPTAAEAISPEAAILTATDGEILFDPKSAGDLEVIKKILMPWKVQLRPAFPDIASVDQTELDDYYAADIPDEFAARRDEIYNLLVNSGLTEDVSYNEIMTLSPDEMQAVPFTAGDTTSALFPVNDPLADSMTQLPLLDFRAFSSLLTQKTPVKKAKIAILDTGVDAEHEDIKGNFITSGTQHDRDVAGHGTHCAGIAAAVTNNGIGIASFAGDKWVTVTSIKVLGDSGGGTRQGIIAGISAAADRGADVISMSLGGRGDALSRRLYDQAVQYANGKGAIVVVAAGNENRQAIRVLPSASPYVITVSAVDDRGKKASFSNFFNNYEAEMGIAAPGVKILSTMPGNRYARMSGTSMATPCVAGILGVMKALQPSLTTQQAYQILNSTGRETENTAKTGKLVQPTRVLEVL
jgi:thermitase